MGTFSAFVLVAGLGGTVGGTDFDTGLAGGFGWEMDGGTNCERFSVILCSFLEEGGGRSFISLKKRDNNKKRKR